MKPPERAPAVHRCPSCDAELRLIGERDSQLILRCADGHEFEWSSARGYTEQPHPERSERLARAAYAAEWLTAKLRDSQAGVHASVRAALIGIGLSVGTTHLVELFPDGPAEHWGALVTEERQVLTFIVRDDGEFTYEDRTDSWKGVPHYAGIEAILRSLDDR